LGFYLFHQLKQAGNKEEGFLFPNLIVKILEFIAVGISQRTKSQYSSALAKLFF
jgi:hypothetical protein